MKLYDRGLCSSILDQSKLQSSKNVTGELTVLVLYIFMCVGGFSHHFENRCAVCALGLSSNHRKSA